MIREIDAIFIIVVFFAIFVMQHFHNKAIDAENLRLLRRVCELEGVLLNQFHIVVQPKDPQPK